MMKRYWVGLIVFSLAVWFGLDWYMDAKQLLWEKIWMVWPLWALLTLVGFLAGGAVWGVIAQAAINQESQTLNKQAEANNEAYRKQLIDKQAELLRWERTLDQRVKQAEQQLDEKEQHAKDKLKTQKRGAKTAMARAVELEANAERLITEAKADNETLKKRARNANKMLERIKKKYAATQGA